MSHPEQREFDDEPATAVMHDDLVAELTARSRDDDPAPFSDEPTKVAKIPVAELFAAAGVTAVDAPSVSAPATEQRLTWRRAALFALTGVIAAMLAVLIGRSLGTR
jgi:hypothetical protein